eukprot:10817-Eustigmatos_ZCMA.PRE.1
MLVYGLVQSFVHDHSHGHSQSQPHHLPHDTHNTQYALKLPFTYLYPPVHMSIHDTYLHAPSA